MSTLSPTRGEGQRGMSGAGKLGIGLALFTALGLVGFGVVAWADRDPPAPSVERPRIVSMEESAQAMQQAGAAMQQHGQAMLMQGGEWMVINPTAPGILVPGAQIDAGNRGELNRSIQAMLHDPSKARSIDVEALNWNGMAMQGEGQNMRYHGQIMAEEVELMIERHGLQGQAVDDLRRGVQVMRQVGGDLMQNGQEMIDYAERIRRSMGTK